MHEISPTASIFSYIDNILIWGIPPQALHEPEHQYQVLLGA
jgi:hypothetical protein